MVEKQDLIHQPETDRLRALLEEDLASSDQAQLLLPAVSRLKHAPVPQSDAKLTAQLIERLGQEMPVVEPEWRRALRHISEYWPLLLMRSQLRVVRREIWAASALVMVLGTLVTLLMQGSTPSSTTLITFLSPIVAAVGVGLLYDNEIEPMLELENATPASTRMLLLARLTLVFGFDLLLSLLASVALALFHAEILLWPLVLSWLAPMAFLSALSFGMSVVSRDALMGSVVGMVLWGFHIAVKAMPEINPLIVLFSLPGLSAPENRLLLLLLAPILLAVTLWFVGRDETRIGERP